MDKPARDDDRLFADILFLSNRVCDHLRTPAQQNTMGLAVREIPADEIALLEGLRAHLRKCEWIRRQLPIQKPKSDEEKELEALRMFKASLDATQSDPILNVSEGGKGSRV